MSEQLVQVSADSPAVPFVHMAQAIGLNDPASFAGAFVLVPPKDGGQPISTLILDSHQDVAQFWSLIKTKAEMALAQLDEASRMGGRGGFR